MVGETEFVRDAAIASRGQGKAEIAGIVAHADLTLELDLCEKLWKSRGGWRRPVSGYSTRGAHDPDKSLAGWMRRLILIYSSNPVLEMAQFIGGAGHTYDRGTTTFRILPILIWLKRCLVRLLFWIILARPVESVRMKERWRT